MTIDTTNKFLVAAHGTYLRIMNLPREPITADDAQLLAAYLVCMSQPYASREFSAVLEAVENT